MCVCVHVRVHETEYTCERECLPEREENHIIKIVVQDKAYMKSLKATISTILVRGVSFKIMIIIINMVLNVHRNSEAD